MWSARLRRWLWRARRALEAFVASDPGLLHLMEATRVTLSAGTAVLALYVLMWVAGASVSLLPAVLSIVVSFTVLINVDDPTRRAQMVTTALLPLPACAAVLLAVWLLPVVWLADLAMVIIIFAAFYVRRFGPRFNALGLLTFMPYYYALFVRATTNELPWLLSVVVLGIGAAAAYRFVLLPDRPARIVRRALDAFFARARLTMDEIIAMVDRPRWDETRERRLPRLTEQLRRTGVAVEDRLDAPDLRRAGVALDVDALRLTLFDMQLAIEALTDATQKLAEAGATERASIRTTLRHAVRMLRRALVIHDAPDRTDDARQALEQLSVLRCSRAAGAPDAWLFGMEHAEVAACELLDAITRITEAAPDPHRVPERGAGNAPPHERPMATALTSGVPPQDRGDQDDGRAGRADHHPAWSWPPKLQPTTAQAIQAVLASVAAIAFGYFFSSSRPYWSVLAAYSVVNASIGATLTKAVQRSVGTLLGAAFGFGLADLVGAHSPVVVAVSFICLLLAYYFRVVSPAVQMFWLTAVLALLYVLLGRFSGQVLALRVADTAVGAGLGLFAAVLVFPSRAVEEVHASILDFLAMLRQFLGHATDDLLGRSPGVDLLREAHDLGGKVNEVSDLARTAIPEALMLGRRDLDLARQRMLLLELSYQANHLAGALSHGPPVHVPARLRAGVEEMGTTVAANGEALRRLLAGDRRVRIQSIDDSQRRLERALRPQLALSVCPLHGEARLMRAASALWRIDRSVTDYARDLGAEEDTDAPEDSRMRDLGAEEDAPEDAPEDSRTRDLGRKSTQAARNGMGQT